MADPRKTLSFEGIAGDYVTFKYDGTIIYDATVRGGAAQVGRAVTLTGNAAATVSTVADGEKVNGKLILVESDGFCNVMVDGYTTLPAGTAAAVTQGSAFVGALLGGVEGYIKAALTAGICTGTIVDATDTTAVVVDLG